MPSRDTTILCEDLRPIAWDSSFFGFCVAELTTARMEKARLKLNLLAAKSHGVRLVYWQSDPATVVPASVLKRFCGALVDRKLTYHRRLSTPTMSYREHEAIAMLTIEQYPVRPASPSLLQLALDAGEYSRFNVDPRFPRLLFRSLYHTWMERCTRHELADAVLIANKDKLHSQGMITVSARAGIGTIGLLAVSQSARGQGIGRSLMNAAESWFTENSIVDVRVTTQQANQRACALYERCGYSITNSASVFHFWPQ